MLSKNKIKLIKSLQNKKQRDSCGCFLAEGNKLVADLLPWFTCNLLVATEEWFSSQTILQGVECVVVSQEEINRASLLKHPQQAMAVFVQATRQLPAAHELKDKLCLALDGIQDPGNLGTIVRVADWLGIEDLFCSIDTADLYNPKTVQATMGALARVKLHYLDLPHWLNHLREEANIPVYGTFLEGSNLYTEAWEAGSVVVMGNEGKGIRHEVEACVSKKMWIPNYPTSRLSSESLNVATATAMVCAELRRRQI